MKDDYRRIANEFREIRNLIKYGIIVLVVFFTVHSGLILMNWDIPYLHFIGMAFITSTCVKLSRLFGLCLLHRACVAYVCIASCALIHYSEFGVCDSNPHIFRVGIILLILLIFKSCKEKMN